MEKSCDMTLLVNCRWQCKCGQTNLAQLHHMDEDRPSGEYANGEVPSDCGQNWVDPCSRCAEYTLGKVEKETGAGLIGWDVVPYTS